MAVDTAHNAAAGAGEHLERSAAFSLLARAGLVARGVVYVVIGAITIEVAAGAGTRPTDQRGALEVIAHEPLGSVLLVVLAVGLAGYSMWRLARAVLGHGPEERDSGLERIAAGASGVSYLVLCALAIEVLVASGAGGTRNSSSKAAGGVLSWPAGPVIVAAVGAVFIGVGGYQAYKGLARKFMDTARTDQMSARIRGGYEVLGVAGHLARAAVFALIGYGLIRAAVDYEPSRAGGLDGALRELAHASYGPELLGAVAAGFIAFGAYSAADARFRKL
jgi:hypothetical protein